MTDQTVRSLQLQVETKDKLLKLNGNRINTLIEIIEGQAVVIDRLVAESNTLREKLNRFGNKIPDVKIMDMS